MFRFLFRFTGLVLITLSFLFVVYDGTKSIADQTIYISRVGPTWVNIHPNSLSAFEPAVERLAGAWIWNDVIQPYFLEQPTALVLVIISALLILLGSKKTSGRSLVADRRRCRSREMPSRSTIASPATSKRSPSSTARSVGMRLSMDSTFLKRATSTPTSCCPIIAGWHRPCSAEHKLVADAETFIGSARDDWWKRECSSSSWRSPPWSTS